MPNNERHVELSLKKFGKENEELIVMINSWIDAPVRRLGRRHRRSRHKLPDVIMDASALFGNISQINLAGKIRNGIQWDTKNKLIAKIVLYHLILDGLVIPKREAKILEELTKEPWILKDS